MGYRAKSTLCCSKTIVFSARSTRRTGLALWQPESPYAISYYSSIVTTYYHLLFPKYNNLLIKIYGFPPFLPSTVLFEALARCVLLGHRVWRLVSKKLESLGYLKWKPHDPTVLSFDALQACDGRTDRQTVTLPIAKLFSSIAERWYLNLRVVVDLEDVV